MKKKIHNRLIDAVNFKQRKARENPHITIAECILMEEGMDDYMKYAAHREPVAATMQLHSLR